MSLKRCVFRLGFALSLVFVPVAFAAPIANPDAFVAVEDSPLTITAPGVLGNDDLNGVAGSLSAAKISDPAHGTVNLQPDGSFVYTPAANYAGPDSFQYKAVEGQGPITFTVDQNASLLNVRVQSFVAATGTRDDKNTDVRAKGTLTAQIIPGRAPFSSAQIRTMNIATAAPASLTLCVAPLCLGTLKADIAADGLLITMREDQAGPAVPVNAGVFSQTDNRIDVNGTLNLSTGGVAGGIEVPPTADLNSTEMAYDFNNAGITQSGGTLTLAVPISITQTITEPDYTATVTVAGTMRATAPVPPAGGESAPVTVTLDVTGVDDLPTANADRYYTRQNHAIAVPAAAIAGTETLIVSNSVWKYSTGADLGTLWRSPEFNDSAWPSGNGVLGYGDADITAAGTIIPASATAGGSKYPTAYFRRDFTLASPFDTVQPRVEFQRDDAVIIYVNGVEIYRDSTPYPGDTDADLPLAAAGEIAYASYASDAIPNADETVYKTVTFSRGLLREGRNVIAAEVHQAGAASSDLRFDLKAFRTTGVGGLAANDVDSDGPALNLQLHTPPSDGSVSLNPDGSFTYLPNPGFPASAASATDTFTYTPTAGGQPITTSAVVVPGGSTWKYLANGTAGPQDAAITAADWRNAAFNDTAWLSGAGEFGYGDGGEATVVEDDATPGSPTLGSTTRYITTYFRHKFTWSGSSPLLTRLKVSVIRDDGVAIFLNGTRIVRDNLPASWNHLTLAESSIGGADETTALEVLDIPAAALQEGENILSAEIHQSAANSSDLSFDMELSAESVIGAKVEIVVLNDDLDGDDMSDTWERANGIDAATANDGEDADGDRSANRAEFLADTDPQSFSSKLRTNALTRPSDGQMEINFDSVPGRMYQLQHSDALGAWLDTGTSFPAHATNPQSARQFPKPGDVRKFYRIRIVQDWQ